MTAIHISADVFNKYHTNGKLRLSTGYVQETLEKQGYPGHDGIVQILKGKEDLGELLGQPFTYRIRICDGIFQYNTLVSADLDDQIKREAEHLVEGAIIAITNLQTFPQGGGVKTAFLITGYKLLSRYHQTLSSPEVKPRSHSGNPEEHLGYRPNIVVEDVWPEAESHASEFQENLSNPPAAKAPKRESGGEPSNYRAPAPEPQRARAAAPPARRGPSNTERGVIPIAMVTPYVNPVKIHGMVTRKEDMRTVPSKNTKVFNFEVTDSTGDTIRCCAFNDVAESFFSTITENLSYYITGGQVRAANKRFNNTGHDYEITLRNDTIIEAGGELLAAPKLNLKRVPLGEIAGHCGDMIDILAIVEKMDPEATEFTSRAGKTLIKREMELIDESQASAKLTLWGEEATKANLDEYLQKVVAFKGVIPKEFNGGYSLSTGGGTRIISVPEIVGVAELYDWYTNTKPSVDFKMVSQTTGTSEAPRTIAALQEMQFGKDSDKGDYVSVKAMVTRINPANALYKGCATDNCQKKVIESDGEYRCEKCNKSMNKFKWLYMIQFELSDETGQVYVTAFGDSAGKVVGKSAAEVGDLKENNPDMYNAVFEQLQFVPKMWRLRCKMETYNEETRQRVTVYGVDDVNQDKYIENLKQLIEQMENISDDGN
uniref:Replication protein A subunit n=1 Tax=Caenorhabditis tropicalis TaxID=1561998 RepID=A0A1I7TVX4_9PELO